MADPAAPPFPNRSLRSERTISDEAGPGLHAVTGAFGYSGRAIARLLLERGRRQQEQEKHPVHDSGVSTASR